MCGAVLSYFACVYHCLNLELCVCDDCLEINSNYVAYYVCCVIYLNKTRVERVRPVSSKQYD